MKTAKSRALTGDRPTGTLHLGHLVGSIESRITLQDEMESFYMIADLQALTHNAENAAKVSDNVLEVALDNLAAGMDPEKTTMFIQSQVPEIAELTQYFLNLVTLARAERNPTIKDEMRQKGYGTDVPLGFLLHPINQAADILIVKANVVPVGEEQLPILEQSNEIIHSFNRIYGETFKKIEAKISHTPRLVGTDGSAKMSKSMNNAIFLADSDATISEKVMAMYTDPTHIRVEDPGHIEGNVVFTFLDVFDSNKAEVEDLKAQYRKGGLGDVILKKRLTKILSEKIAPIRERRTKLANDPESIMKILEEGTRKVRAIAVETLDEVRTKIGINYFNN